MYVVQLKYVMATQVGIPFYFVIFKSASMPIYKLVLLIIHHQNTFFGVYPRLTMRVSRIRNYVKACGKLRNIQKPNFPLRKLYFLFTFAFLRFFSPKIGNLLTIFSSAE